jgi:hypothetical protein
MKLYISFSVFLIFLFSCKTHPNSRISGGDVPQVFKLSLSPPIGAKYYYNLVNRTELKLEAEGKKIDNLNKADIGVIYYDAPLKKGR